MKEKKIEKNCTFKLSPALFEKFFRLYARELYWVSMAYVNNKNTAEDVVQESFMYLWNNKKRISSEDNIHAYLRQIVKNKSISHIRHVRVREKHESRVTEELLFSAQRGEDENDLEEKIQCAKELINSLPENCRRIFLLCVVEGMSYKEAAKELSLSINTIKSQMKIAYQKMRKNGISKSLFILALIVNLS